MGVTGLTLRVATWNVHRCVGHDGRCDPARTRRAIVADIAPNGLDILVLTEADTDCPPHRGLLDLSALEAATGLRSVHAPDARWGEESDGFLGVIILVRASIPVAEVRVLDLPGHCHRGAVVVDLAPPGGAPPLRLVGTHLSLAQWLRAVQMRTIGQHLRRRAPCATLLVGDLNEWRPWGGLALSRRVVGRPLHGPSRRSFPAYFPILPLDWILSDRVGMVMDARVIDTPEIRAASDHLPLAATIRVGPET